MRSGQGCHHPPPGCSPSLQQAEAQDTGELGNTNSGLKFRSVVLKWKCLEISFKRNPASCFGATERLKNNLKRGVLKYWWERGRTCICGLYGRLVKQILQAAVPVSGPYVSNKGRRS